MTSTETSTETSTGFNLTAIVINPPVALVDPAHIWIAGQITPVAVHVGDTVGVWHPSTGHLVELVIEEIHRDSDGEPVALFGTSHEGDAILVDAAAEYVA